VRPVSPPHSTSASRLTADALSSPTASWRQCPAAGRGIVPACRSCCRKSRRHSWHDPRPGGGRAASAVLRAAAMSQDFFDQARGSETGLAGGAASRTPATSSGHRVGGTSKMQDPASSWAGGRKGDAIGEFGEHMWYLCTARGLGGALWTTISENNSSKGPRECHSACNFDPPYCLI
jgi:hypothetical protein